MFGSFLDVEIFIELFKFSGTDVEGFFNIGSFSTDWSHFDGEPNRFLLDENLGDLFSLGIEIK